MNPAQMTAPGTGNRARAAAKILFDRMGAAIALLVLSPVLAAIALGIRFTMGTPIVFRQVRAGRHGMPFTILKFRTMKMRDASCCRGPNACRGIQMGPVRAFLGSWHLFAGPASTNSLSS
jgi:lipopolysaccharide/colanic/teichoic acid biosynthesis glycosyltransferase